MQAFSEDWFENCDHFLNKTTPNIFQECISLVKLNISKSRFITDLFSGASKYQLAVTPRWIDSPDFSSSSTVLSMSFKFSTREIKSSFFYRIRPNLSFDCIFQHSSCSNFAITMDVLTRLSYDMFTGAIILSLTWLCDFFEFNMICSPHLIDTRATMIRITTNQAFDSQYQCILVVTLAPSGTVNVCYSHFNETSGKFENQNISFSSVSSSTIMSKLIHIFTLIYSYYQDSYII
ncbi:hypothetical protein MXB_201 [Myxobolus squamalis]|nr:hypothetical protein MXB_201 [Myxobolus squamalis]